MGEHLSWLHVSDFHLQAGTDPFSQDEATRALLDDVVSHLERPFSFVVVTGDLAFSGQGAEYAVAQEVLATLATAVHVPPDRFFLVPGNHDVDRAKEELAFAGAHATLTTQASVDRLLGLTTQLEPLLRRQSEFWAFVDGFTHGQDRRLTPDGLGYVATLAEGPLRISIIGLNSAWMSGRDDEGMKLLVGERQVIDALRMAQEDSPHLRIALAHHPVEWLREWDSATCNKRLLSSIEIYQRGHLHHPDVSVTRIKGRDCVMIAAGSSHATRHYENSYNIVELDLTDAVCTIRPFRYVPHQNRFEPDSAEVVDLKLGSVLPGDLAEWVDAIAEIDDARPYAGYLAGLLVGYQEEIPVRLGETGLQFVAPGAARRLAPPEEIAEVEAFLKLRNRLRLYDSDISVMQRVALHKGVVAAVAGSLRSAAVIDRQFEEELMRRAAIGSMSVTQSSRDRRPQAIDLLHQLRQNEDWIALEEIARRFQSSDDPDLAIAASWGLVESLMYSDEGEKRAEAAELAASLADAETVGLDGLLLAAASADLVKDDERAVDYMLRAIELQPNDNRVGAQGRLIATHTGDDRLKRALEGLK